MLHVFARQVSDLTAVSTRVRLTFWSTNGVVRAELTHGTHAMSPQLAHELLEARVRVPQGVVLGLLRVGADRHMVVDLLRDGDPYHGQHRAWAAVALN